MSGFWQQNQCEVINVGLIVFTDLIIIAFITWLEESGYENYFSNLQVCVYSVNIIIFV